MRILAISDWHGKEEVLPDLAGAIRNPSPDIIVFTGDILQWRAKCSEWASARGENRLPRRELPQIKDEIQRNAHLYQTFYQAIKGFNLPFFAIPGNVDSPLSQYIQIAWETMKKDVNLHMAHSHPHILDDHLVISGFGGEITEEEREDFFVLQFPRWEVEVGLSFLSGFPHEKILLAHTPPLGILDADDDKHKGNQVINDLIRKFRPRWLFCGHAHGARGTEMVEECMVVNPGALKNGFYALVDTERKEVELKSL